MTIDYEERMLHVQLWAESGMSKRAYAKENGINRNTFYGWCSKREARVQPEEQPLVELGFEERQAQSVSVGAGTILLQTENGYRLQITGILEKNLLRELLDVLEVR